MAGSTFQPPIHLDPSQDDSQRVAFINNNFQSLASALETNSFRVVISGTITINQVTITATAGTYGSVNVSVASFTHNLGYRPAFIAFFENTNGVRTGIPYTLNDVSGSNVTWQSYNAAVTNTLFFINLRGLAYNNSFNTLSGAVKFFLLQEPAE